MRWLRLGILILMIGAYSVPAFAQASPDIPPALPLLVDQATLLGELNFSQSVNLLLAVTSISFLPFLLVSTTCFVRCAIVLGILRNAIGTGQSPPNIVIISVALFLTIYVMSPTWLRVYEDAVLPYRSGEITQNEAWANGIQPFRQFMFKFTRQKDLALFIEFAKIGQVTDINDVPIYVLIPAYMISELQTAFQIGFLLFIPFVVIDLVVSNILLSLGMFMLSPVMVSLPFKILLFVLTDGWNLIIRGLLTGLQ